MFAFRKKYKPEAELLDLTGKVALVTGGSNGIGYWTVQLLVRRGAKVYMGARSEKKATDAIKQLEKEGLGTMGGTVIWHMLDLSHPRLAKESAEKLIARETRLDIIINNAAQFAGPYVILEDGVQDLMVVNHLSPFTLVDTLLPLMEKTAALPGADCRIVNLGSAAHSSPGKIDSFVGKESLNRRFTDSTKGEITRYGLTKLACILYTVQLQKELKEKNIPITVITADPGMAPTGGAIDYFGKLPLGGLIIALMKALTMTTTQAAMTSVYASASKTIANNKEKYQGKMLVPYGKIEKPSKEGQDPRLAKELWDTTEVIMKEIWEKEGKTDANGGTGPTSTQPHVDAMSVNPVM